MTNLQAAVGCGELLHLDEYVEKKIWMANEYVKRLKNVFGIRLPFSRAEVKNVYWMFGVVLDPKKNGTTKDELRVKLKNEGIDTRDFFYSPEDQPVLKEVVGKQTFPQARFLAEQGFYLPSGLAISEDQIVYVCDMLKKCLV